MGEDFVPKVFSLILFGSSSDLFAYVPHPSLFDGMNFGNDMPCSPSLLSTCLPMVGMC
jgi:hypothetical protein